MKDVARKINAMNWKIMPFVVLLVIVLAVAIAILSN